METYKNIIGFENYEVSNYGNVRNITTGKIMKSSLNKDGYYIIDLYHNNKRKTFLLHRLVGKAFIDNPQNKSMIDHIDNDRTNNNVNNLRWASNSENQHNKKISKNNTTGFKGVTFCKKLNKYKAQIMIGGKYKYIGSFDKLEDAAKARQLKASELFGEFLNDCERRTVKLELPQVIKQKTKINLVIELEPNIDELEREFLELINQ
jgi:hypothetical protein